MLKRIPVRSNLLPLDIPFDKPKAGEVLLQLKEACYGKHL